MYTLLNYENLIKSICFLIVNKQKYIFATVVLPAFAGGL